MTSRHSFSFGRHYDPENVGFGLLIMNNDDVVEPGHGYPTHPHRDVEIVTWVLDGALVHRDTTGAGGVIHPGLAQRLSAGRGVRHSEFNDHRPSPLRFVQMWVPPDSAGADPSYGCQDVSEDLDSGGLVTVASGMPRYSGSTAITLGQRAAAMHVARLSRQPAPVERGGGDARAHSVTLPTAPFLHLYVARGTADVEGVGRLGEGDAVRIIDEGGRRVTAAPSDSDAAEPGPAAGFAEIISWEMHADLRPA
ncbi:pirin family protein [Phytoactinopolyspora halotolerans]|uniref:pirin family protein n=1 Tax=Phytoactinopolyspora halotolerans TaxID=1981512 RepID=UPI001C20783E|nr:pirin family protein [Phytoactinopolyspora halotolerans]